MDSGDRAGWNGRIKGRKERNWYSIWLIVCNRQMLGLNLYQPVNAACCLVRLSRSWCRLTFIFMTDLILTGGNFICCNKYLGSFFFSCWSFCRFHLGRVSVPLSSLWPYNWCRCWPISPLPTVLLKRNQFRGLVLELLCEHGTTKQICVPCVAAKTRQASWVFGSGF